MKESVNIDAGLAEVDGSLTKTLSVTNVILVSSGIVISSSFNIHGHFCRCGPGAGAVES